MRHDRRAHRLLRPAGWAPWRPQPGTACGDLRAQAARSRSRPSRPPRRPQRRAGLMGARQRFAVPDGWIARGFRFEVEVTSPEQRGRIAQHFGARRFAYNWALEQVKASLDARTTDPSVSLLPWNLYELRRAWNQAKHQAAPWWPTCSKEAYASGVAD